ncbi:MAG: type VI secretion system ATPase TssH [Mesorhizobium amorphae]|nr:MAG: type VI secretion system ATPase TssH [Mesorhizobium amorphae]
MSAVDLQHLIKRLDTDARISLEGAAALAVRSSHEAIELAHWMGALASRPAFRTLLEDSGVDPQRFEAECTRAVAEMRRGTGSTPAFSQNVIALAREAWLGASLTHDRGRVGLADLLHTLCTDSSLRIVARAVAPSLREINLAPVDAARNAGASVDAGSGDGSAEIARSMGGAGAGGEDFLKLYTQDMTADAAEGRIDPVVGRDPELRQVIDILLRRRQNNPILVGEAGVGKTAVAEAFALAVHAGQVPEKLRGVRLLSLDLSLLQAGAGVKGEFERRLRGVVDAVKASPQPVILFIDEAHGLIGAGNQAGQGDAANILKPSLARGELRTIAATTWGEYKRYIERDPALTRRFQPVKVEEPDEETAVRMLRGVVGVLSRHHGVRIRDEALRAAVQLSARYIPARQLPDKAISLLDTAAASVAFSRESDPALLNDKRREREHLVLEAERLGAEPSGEDAETRLAEIEDRNAALDEEIADLEAKLESERALLEETDRLEDAFAEDESARGTYPDAAKRLRETQGEAALVHRVVDADAIAAVVARWTGVPVGRLVSDQITAVGTLADRLKRRVVGQDAALDALSSAMRVSRAKLSDPRRPPGVFLMVGMSGVGKTETALALADLLYGGPQYLTTINMSEFKEEHKVSMLVGSPPGYVGFGEGGVLTEAVRRRPYGVLLLDEMDKAHPGVQDVFYQLFDKGSLRDGEGRDIDFKNTVILMTANTGSDVLAALAADPETMPEGEALAGALKGALLEQFRPAFLGRTTVLAFRPLDHEALAGIVDIQIERLRDRVRETYGAALSLSATAREHLAANAEAGDAGARAIETTIAGAILPVLASFFLEKLARGDGAERRPAEIDFVEGAFVVVPAPKPFAVPTVTADTPASFEPADEPERMAV